MLIKSDTATTNSSGATECDNCHVMNRLMHHARHRGNCRRFCTSCILRLNPQSFCPTCFQVYPSTVPNDAARNCVKCYSHSHSHCVEAGGGGAPPPNPYICPLCVNPTAPVFKLKSANVEIGGAKNVENCKVMDRDAARMLLAAAKIASTSMNKAAVAAKAEAERKVKEAAYTRKRAKEALEHVAHLVIKEKARRKEAALGRGYGGVNPSPAGKIKAEIAANMGVSNRNGVMAIVPSVPRPIVAVGEHVGNADRENPNPNSNQVLAALNAVELRENERMGIAHPQGEGEGEGEGEGDGDGDGEGSGVTQADDHDHAHAHAPMDIDGGGENVAGLIGDSSGGGANLDMEIGAGDERENVDGVNKEMVLVQPKEDDGGV